MPTEIETQPSRQPSRPCPRCWRIDSHSLPCALASGAAIAAGAQPPPGRAGRAGEGGHTGGARTPAPGAESPESGITIPSTSTAGQTTKSLPLGRPRVPAEQQRQKTRDRVRAYRARR